MLVQLKREGAGIWLVDPEALDGLAPLQEALAGVEWILHAASQDLPCLAEQGLRPDRLFDTELAARVSGLPRVGLAAVLEELLGSPRQGAFGRRLVGASAARGDAHLRGARRRAARPAA